MAEKVLKTRIQLKYDTLQNWTTNDPVLKIGELAIATIDAASPANKQLPPVMFKVGDGTSRFSELDWASALAADVYGWAKQSGITVGTSGTGNVVTGLSWDSANSRLLITKGDYVPSTRKINNKALSADITLSAADVGVTETAFPGLNKVGTVTGVKMNGAAKTVGTDGVVDLGTVITSHQDISGKQDKIKAGTHITIGADGVTVNAAWPTDSDAGYAGINKTGTITGVTMNGASKGTSGVVDLGTVLTEHQTIAEGATNGTISVAGTDVKVHGLGSAAYKAEGAFDAAGSATTAANGVLGNNTDDATANTVYGAKAAAKAAQDTIDNYKTSNDAALAGVKATAEAAQTSEQVDAKISAHNISTTAHNDIRQSITALSEKVSGRATGYVFKNKSDAKYTAAIGKTGSFVIGDTIYFTDNNIPDQWVVAVNSTSPYYTFQDIETEKTNLSGYVNALSGTANKGVVTNITKSGSTITVTSESLAVSAPAESGTALSFIDSVSQAANGKITASKKTVSDATKTTHGLMSGADKTKLDGIAEGANNYELPVASATAIGGVKPGTTSGKNYGVAVDTNGAMTVNVPWADTKVTSAENHYTPSADSASQLSADASGTTAASWDATSMVTGVNIQRDAKGHVTGVTVDSVKMPANPNTNTAHTHTSGVGLVKTGDGGISGVVDYKVALASEALDTNAAVSRPAANANRTYPVIADKNGKLATIVPWTDNNTVTTVSTTANGGLKVVKTNDDYKVDIDEDVVFIFDCGSSTVNI